MAQSRRRPHAPPAARLPGLLRAIRIAELLFFPVVCFMLLSLPVPSVTSAGEMVTYAILVAEAFAAVAVFVGLGRKKTWAWLLAMVLAAWVLTGIVRLGRLASLASQPGNTVLVWSLVLVAWTFIAQLVILGCCLAFIPRRRELG